MNSLVINSRTSFKKTTGAQRYLRELVARFPVDSFTEVHPANSLQGGIGHAWEQFVLPTLCKKKTLWSPSNNGPLSVKRQVLTIHDIVPLDHPEWVNKKLAKWLRWLLPRLAKRVEHIITVSEYSKQRIVDRLGVPEQKVSVIYNGVDDRFKAIRSIDIETSISDLPHLPEKYILSLGSIEPRKNISRLLQAWKLAQIELPADIFLVIAGGMGDKHIFGKEAEHAWPDRTVPLGYVDDTLLPALYKHAMAFTYVSEYEGFGLPVAEAMSCGTVPIASSKTSLPEVVGKAGLLVDPHDIEEIAQALINICVDSELRNRLRNCAQKQIRLFDWDKAARDTFSILSSV
ncbi:mannosyltransferase [Rhodopirellula baltica SH28]|uniref:Mannosyltransferase n=1 Tax=Rhodopirellula baltica SH28 TaxID=993517 RepID=K5DAJ7_RHOBT|nr:glycosyltransferase family 1 protein [Rhodopirellula baltica]EKJ99823.1 mannosyltransferase [Rhodopirellula baltica SH28]